MVPLAGFLLSTFLIAGASQGAFAAVPPALPQSANESGCSSDVFSIDGSAVTVALCAADTAKTAKTVVTETLSMKGQTSFSRDVPLDRVPGADSSRAIDDVPLAKLGLARTLHLTIAVKNGAVRLEHALLVPGAEALK